MAESYRWHNVNISDMSEYTLIIPSVAIGNVGQLACDLIISSLRMTKISSVFSPAVIPVCGYDPYNAEPGTLSACCDLYQCDKNKLFVLQIRAPLVYKYAEQFLTMVVDKFKEKKIKDIIILASCFASEMRHILTSPFRYVANEFCPYTSMIKSLEWVKHEPKEESLKIFGGGFATLLYEITTQKSVPCLLIYKFTSEGYNIPDAYEMVQYVNKLVPLYKEEEMCKKLIEPVSWKLPFGRPHTVEMY